jgi:hypothetical protein
MQFNHYTYNDMARTTYNGAGDYKEASDDELQYLASPVTTIVAVTTYADSRDHVIQTASLRDSKIQLLLTVQSNDDDAFTSVVFHFDTEQYTISDRQKALSWLGIAKRPLSRIMDADLVEYVDEHELTVMS